MDLGTYLKTSNVRAGVFAKRIGVAPSTISGWLRDPARGPSRAKLVAIERETGGLVTARDFACGEQCAENERVPGQHVVTAPAEAA